MDFGLSSTFSVDLASFVVSLLSAATVFSIASTESAACVGSCGLSGSGVFGWCCAGSGELLFSAGFSVNASFLLLATLDGASAALGADFFDFFVDAADDEDDDDEFELDDDEDDDEESLSLPESLLDELGSRFFSLISAIL